MSTMIESQREIPKAKFYVTATDTFLSGWGQSEGKDNRVILPCDDHREAETVAANARRRSDMSNVRICSGKPRLHRWNTYSLMCREDASRWYEPDAF